MKKYQVLFSNLAAKELRHLPKEEIKRVYTKAKDLETDPRPSGCKKLVGEKENIWRVRVGDYRIVYTINDEILIVDIRRIGNRRDVYNK